MTIGTGFLLMSLSLVDVEVGSGIVLLFGLLFINGLRYRKDLPDLEKVLFAITFCYGIYLINQFYLIMYIAGSATVLLACLMNYPNEIELNKVAETNE